MGGDTRTDAHALVGGVTRAVEVGISTVDPIALMPAAPKTDCVARVNGSDPCLRFWNSVNGADDECSLASILPCHGFEFLRWDPRVDVFRGELARLPGDIKDGRATVKSATGRMVSVRGSLQVVAAVVNVHQTLFAEAWNELRDDMPELAVGARPPRRCLEHRGGGGSALFSDNDRQLELSMRCRSDIDTFEVLAQIGVGFDTANGIPVAPARSACNEIEPPIRTIGCGCREMRASARRYMDGLGATTSAEREAAEMPERWWAPWPAQFSLPHRVPFVPSGTHVVPNLMGSGTTLAIAQNGADGDIAAAIGIRDVCGLAETRFAGFHAGRAGRVQNNFGMAVSGRRRREKGLRPEETLGSRILSKAGSGVDDTGRQHAAAPEPRYRRRRPVLVREFVKQGTAVGGRLRATDGSGGACRMRARPDSGPGFVDLWTGAGAKPFEPAATGDGRWAGVRQAAPGARPSCGAGEETGPLHLAATHHILPAVRHGVRYGSRTGHPREGRQTRPPCTEFQNPVRTGQYPAKELARVCPRVSVTHQRSILSPARMHNRSDSPFRKSIEINKIRPWPARMRNVYHGWRLLHADVAGTNVSEAGMTTVSPVQYDCVWTSRAVLPMRLSFVAKRHSIPVPNLVAHGDRA